MNNQIKPTAKRAEPPDKSLFNAMMGVSFLLFAIAPAYWAFYNYGEYRQTTALVQELKEKPEPFITPAQGKEKENRISLLSSRANRYNLEMLLSAAASLLLFGVAGLLFRKALRSRKIKNEYKPLAFHSIPIPANRLEVRYKFTYTILFALIAVFFTLMALLISYQTLNSQFESANGKIIKGVLLPACLFLVLGFISYLMLRANRQAVKLFDSSGIIRGDGRHFEWQDFRGIVTQIGFNQRTQRRYVWRLELAFPGGESAWIIPNRVKNMEEVSLYLNSLPQAVLESD